MLSAKLELALILKLTLRTKFVTMMKTTYQYEFVNDRAWPYYKPGPRFFGIFSFAASLALVDDAGYSPPTPFERHE